MFLRVAGMDVHKDTIVTCIRITDAQGNESQTTRTFGTMTDDLLALYDWLVRMQVTHIAMESTGVLWKPVWNVLEGGPWRLHLVNPKDLKHVPGRKSDPIDARWIAQLQAHGLLKSSYVPQRNQRDLRDLTRQRAQLAGELTRCVNRIHKVLQDANLKLSSVATDIMGLSGREMLAALVNGKDDPQELAELAKGKLRAKIPELKRALKGSLTAHHQFMLEQLLDHVAHLEQQLAAFSARIEEELRPFVDDATFERLDAVPGLNRQVIENVVAEIGVKMTVFPSSDHLSSWAGLCPGNEESAGKRKRSRTRKGNVWLRRTLTQAAWAAARKKNSYFQGQYRRLAGRRGKKRAVIAVAHSLLEVVYHLLKDPTLEYKDLGANHFDTLDPKRLCRHLVKRLEALGYSVKLERPEAA
jgi:transposase